MRYCNHCHRMTAGQPLFCNYCGRSYDVKLCPQRHANPRSAEICSQCGSRELSAPHPRVSFLIRPLLFFFTVLPGVALAALSIVFAFSVIRAVLLDQRLLFQSAMAGLLLAFLWYLYSNLPQVLRRLLTKLFHSSNRDNKHGH